MTISPFEKGHSGTKKISLVKQRTEGLNHKNPL